MLKRSGGEGKKSGSRQERKNEYNERAGCPGRVKNPMEQDVQTINPRHGNGTDGAELWKSGNKPVSI